MYIVCPDRTISEVGQIGVNAIGNFVDNNCEIILDGGILNVTILDDGSIVLKGPTEISFQGTFGDRINKLIKSN